MTRCQAEGHRERRAKVAIAPPDCWCEGCGERYWHSDECEDPHCALAGGPHDCDGEMQICREHATDEQWARTRDDHTVAAVVYVCVTCGQMAPMDPHYAYSGEILCEACELETEQKLARHDFEIRDSEELPF